MKQLSLLLSGLGLMLCVPLIAGARPIQAAEQSPVGTLDRSEVISYEGQGVSSIELAGRPDLDADKLMPLVTQHSGEPFSFSKIDQSLAALKKTAQFQDVQLDLRPEQDGVRVMFVLQPSTYFGIYQFAGAGQFAYPRLLQVSNYSPQEPYSAVDVKNALTSLKTFFQRNGYFQAEVQAELQADPDNGLVNVTFQVTLNKPAKIGEIAITGATPEEATHLKDELHSLRARIRLSAVRSGKEYSLKALQNATSYLEGRLNKEGRLAAQARLSSANYNPETNRADISFDVNPGPVVIGKVEGAHLWSWTKRRLLPIYQQVGVTPELIQEGRQNLISYFRQKGFFDVQVATDFQAEPDTQTVLYKIVKGQRKEIGGANFTGNQHISENDLLQHVTLSKGRLFSNGSYNESSVAALKAFYQSQGFNQVKVSPTFNTHSKTIVITFAIEEGPRDIVDALQIQGNKTASEKEFAPDGLRLASGQPYSQKFIDDDRNKVTTYYLEHGYLSMTFHVTAQPSPADPHKYRVIYDINEGPQVRANSIVTIGLNRTKQKLIDTDTADLQVGQPLAERDILTSEGHLANRGIFDWEEVNPRRQITSQSQEDVLVKVHEAKRNSATYGFGFEVVNRGGSIPTGTVAVPGLPPIGLPSTFTTDQHTFKGPRADFQYTRSNIGGKAQSLTAAALAGPLVTRASFTFTDPNFRWTKWTASVPLSAEHSAENPLFTSRTAQLGIQFQRALDEKKHQNVFVRYTLSQTGLSALLIPQLVPTADLHTRLSTVSGTYIRDTRENPLDTPKGSYQTVELDVNPRALGSSVSFAKLLTQTSYYHAIFSNIIWANSLRIGVAEPFVGSHVPISQTFFTGGGSTLRGFPLNGAGPQSTIPACGNPSDPSTCSLIRVPTGGSQLLIFNSELRIPIRLKKGLGLATFYDGGNVYDRVGFANLFTDYTNSVGIGLRYATPVGPIRVDVGRNLNPVSGISRTQFFLTLGQAF